MVKQVVGRVTYTDLEKDSFVEIVTRYATILENKKSDAVSLNLKVQTWEKLSTEYNSINEVHPRDVKQLKKLWENLKGKWKTAEGEETRTIFATGKNSLLLFPSLISSIRFGFSVVLSDDTPR